MRCPVCKQDMMVIEYRDVELDYCPGCHGVWFDSGELELLLDSYGLGETKQFLDDVAGVPGVVRLEKRRRCPICGQKMKKANLGGQAEVLVDVCRDEHGLWFDRGEVVQVVRHLAQEHLPPADPRAQVISFLEEVFPASE